MPDTPDPPALGTRTIHPEPAIGHGTLTMQGDPQPAATPPSRLGRFEIKRVLGEGAFGRVYEAFDPSLKRVVALKVAKPDSLAGEHRLERFHREAQSAANLLHPNIVAVFDHGQDGANHYIASAFVPGVPLDGYLAGLDGPPSAEEAARVVRRLAGALAYAHRTGVIHRDVKPANVLLRPDGHPMLTDFGLAARLEDDSQPTSPPIDEPVDPIERGKLTRDGSAVGTPAYLAPEQWRGLAEAASDQYSLGCVLYEMLTGQTPFSGSSEAHYAALHLAHPPTPPRSVRPSVPRDLEAICLKCLAKAPKDRYADCQALAQDLRRWEEGEPVAARPPGVAESLARWVRKRPAVAGLLAAVLVTVAVAFGLVSWQWQQALYQKGQAEEAREQAAALAEQERDARDRATAEAQQARLVRDFLANLFRASNPTDFGGYFLRSAREKGSELTARQLLERGALDLKDKLKDQPQARAALLVTVGDAFRGLGRHEEARAALREALTLLDRQPGPSHPDNARCRFYLGWVEMERGDYDAAESLLRTALVVQEARLAADDPATVDTRMLIAWMYTLSSDPRGIDLWKGVVAARSSRHGPRHPETLIAKIGLAAMYLDQERLGEAMPLVLDVFTHTSSGEGGQTNLQAIIQFQAGVLANRQGFDSVALGCYERSLKLAKLQLSENHPYLGFTYHQLGFTLVRLNRYKEAEARMAECVRILRGSAGMEFPRALVALRQYSQILNRLGKADQARALWEEALAANTKRFGPDNRWRFHYLAQRAIHEARSGNEAVAVEMAREALRLRARASGRDSEKASDLRDVGWALFQNKNADQALTEACFRDAETIWRSLAANTASNRAVNLARFGEMLHGQGRYREAEPILRDAAEKGKGTFLDRGLDGIDLNTQLGDIELAKGRPDEATTRYRVALALARKLSPPMPVEVVKVLESLAGPLVERKQWDEAVAMLREAVVRPVARGKPERYDNPHRYLAYVEMAAGRPAEARKWIDAYIETFRHHAGPRVRLLVIRGTLVVAPDHPGLAANGECLLAELETLAAKLPGEPIVPETITLALLRLGRPDEAEAYLKVQPAARQGREAFWMLCRAWSAALREQPAEARQLLARAEEQARRLAPSPSDPDAAAVDWHARLEVRLLLDEVGRLLADKPKGDAAR